MKKTRALFWQFFKVNWMQEAEFRANLIINSIMELGWSLLFLLFTQVLFGHVQAIAGWQKNEIMLLVVTRSLSMGLLRAFLLPGIERLSQKIRTGSLDMMLTKPVSTRILLAISEQNMDTYLRTLVSAILVFGIASNMGLSISPIQFLSFWTIIILGIFSLYNVFFIMNTTAFWLTNLSNIGHLNNTLTDVAQFPPEAYEKRVRLTLLYLVPTIFMAAIPTRILLGSSFGQPLFLVTIFAVGTLVLSQWFWKFALKHYSSASS